MKYIARHNVSFGFDIKNEVGVLNQEKIEWGDRVENTPKDHLALGILS